MGERRPCEAGCTLGFVNIDGTWRMCPACRATGSQEVAELVQDFVAGQVASILLGDNDDE